MQMTVRGRTFEVPGEPVFFDHFGDEMDLVEEYWKIEPGDVVLDVGAGAGRYSLPALAADAELVYAIEPKTEWLGLLLHVAELNGWGQRLIGGTVALGNGTFPEELVTMIEGSRNAELSPRGASWSTLDEVWQRGVLDWVKIDVEGQEIAVLEGGRRTLETFAPTLWIEDHSRVYDELGAAHHERLTGLLGQLGYDVEVVSYPGPIARDYLLCRA